MFAYIIIDLHMFDVFEYILYIWIHLYIFTYVLIYFYMFAYICKGFAKNAKTHQTQIEYILSIFTDVYKQLHIFAGNRCICLHLHFHIFAHI